MTIDSVKELVRKNKGELRSFVFHGSRNQIDEFKGVITAMYPAIFVITSDGSQIRSFSYSDLLVSNLEIID